MSTIKYSELLEFHVNERIRLVSALWDGISGNLELLAITGAESKILDKRTEAYIKNPTAGKPWSQIKLNY